MVELIENGIRLSSGTEIYADRGFVGINHQGELGGGHAARLLSYGNFAEGYDDYLTPAERNELADYVISLWQRYKEQNPVGAR